MKLYFVLISFAILGDHSGGVPASTNSTLRIIKSPKISNVVLVGSKIKLEWKFVSQPAKELSRTVLFRYNVASKAKNTIASKTDTSAKMQYNPYQTDVYQCEIYQDKRGIGSASITINNIQFNHSGNYGIGLQPRQEHLPRTENSVSVTVVDMVTDQDEDLRIVTSWVGRETFLTCKVVYRATTPPKFQWVKKSSNQILTDGISTSNNKSVLRVKPTNSTDFGEYICKARSQTASVTQTFMVIELGYSEPPRDVEYTFDKERKVYRVFWKQAVTQGYHRAKGYEVQIWKPEKEHWKSIHKTERLLIPIENLKSSTKLRVCSLNEIGYIQSSCSQPILLVVQGSVQGESGERGKSCARSSRVFLILMMVLMSSLVTLYDSD